MNKKLILASLLCLGALVGCGGNDKPATSEPTPTPGTSEVTPTPGTSTTTPEVNYGTLEAPLTITEARAIIASIGETVEGGDKIVTDGTIYVKGTVSKIEEGKHGFKSEIKTGEEVLGLFYIKTKTGVNTPKVGDEVICSGLGQNYKGTFQLVADKQGENFVGPTFEKITKVGETTTPDTPDTPTGPVAEMKYTGETTTNFTGEGNEAASVGLDPTMFTVTADNGDRVNSWDGSNTPLFPGLNKAGEIRLYDKGGKKHGVTVTIAAGYEITTISVAANRQPNVRIGETDVAASEDGSYAINGSVFFLGNDGAGQVKITSVTINYATK